MIDKEYPIYAFEERRRFGVSMQEIKNESSILESFLEKQEIERKTKKSAFNVFVENCMQQWRRGGNSFYQIIRYKDYILLEFLIEYREDDDIDELCFRIENCNKLFIEGGDEGLKSFYKKFLASIKSKNNSDFLEKYRTHYNLHFIDCIRKSRNPIQVEKTDQEQTLKITYKVDL
ncbi:hypothetical protein WAF17_18585 [Bernardetia sp. ABR2-2B]|uniref:hypothetical protein n=1 Tax=Bernardetia sp. ABR2-2B TaxID=3127472 RepID=UPI0030CBEB7A